MDSKASIQELVVEESVEEQAIVMDSEEAIEEFVVEELKDGGSLCNEYEFNKLMEEMECTIRQVQESDFYCNMLQQFQNSPDFQTHIHRVLGNDYEQRIQMVIYGIGSIQFSLRSQYQLAMAILLSRDMSHWIEQVISIFDPCFTPLDAKVVTGLGHQVENINQHFRRKVEIPTLFYLPCVDFPELGNLLEVNWCPSRLNKIMLLTNVYPGWVALSTYAEKALEYAVKFDCHYNYKGPKLPCKTKWPFDETFFYFFNLSPETNLEMMRKRSKPNMFVSRWRRDQDDEEDDDFQVLDETTFAKNCVRLVKSSIRVTSPKLFEAYDDASVDTREDWLEQMHAHRFPVWPGRIKWCPPYSGWIKLNFSAAYYSQLGSSRQVVGYGGLFHTENNECLHSYSGPLLEDLDEYAAFDGGVVDLDFANAVALCKGLKVFMELPSSPNARKLIIEGDAVSVLRWANSLIPPPKRLAGIFQEIFKLLCHMETAVLPIYKEANSMAIELAKERASKLLDQLDHQHSISCY